MGRKPDAHVSQADALETLKVGLVERALKQGHEPGAVQALEAGQAAGILEKFGGVGHVLEKPVEVLHHLIGLGLDKGGQAEQRALLVLPQAVILPNFLKGSHGGLLPAASPKG
jgi:hypothetical protein